MPLGLPDRVTACLFDLDGVLTPTAAVHTAAWKETFDAYLRERADRTGEPFVPFDAQHEYQEYVDGRARADGVRTFLTSRGITLGPDDTGTVREIGDRKNERVLQILESDGVKPYPGSVAYLQAARAAGLHPAVVTASANCHQVLVAAGLDGMFEAQVDGVTLAQRHLRGKPAPDSFLAAAELLGVPAAQAAVFEDAESGVQAGRAGGFGYVIGVDRVGHAAALHEHGADVVVADLADLLAIR